MGDRSERVKAIFFEAIEGHAPELWPAFLERACAGDAELRAEVEKLLRARTELRSFHEPPRLASLATVDDPVSERPGTVIGPYKLVQVIGEGGMGAVWMAQQTEPVKRLVALKVIKPGMDSRQVIARFEAERQALALMDHPNIARVFDAGTTSAGRPYFVMELVKGLPLTKFCDERRLPPRGRLELFIQVCQAIQHAHQKGIIHRDIKPSNVLVALYDGRPVPKVIDFGVAKATGQQLTDHTLVTGFGAVVGTLQYMSPEQAELNQLDIDTRSDIYSLGVLLYELLTGSTPLEKKRVKEAAMLEVLRLIREEEPPRPSTRLSATDEMPSVAACRGLEPKKLSGQVRGELDWIVMKALDKDRDRRYETANGFAADLQRYLADEPVRACPPSVLYRFRKFARRNKAILTAAALILLALVAGTTISTWQAIRATRAGDAERAAREEAQDNLVRATQAEKDVRNKLWASYLGEANALRLSQRRGQRFGSLAAVRKALQLPLPPGRSLAELRNAAAGALTLPDVEIVQELEVNPPGTGNPAFDGALARYTRTDSKGSVSVRRVADDSEIVRIPGPGNATGAILSPDGHLIAVHHRKAMQLKVYRLSGPGLTLVHEYADVGPLGDVDFTPDNQRFLYYNRDSRISIVTLADGQVTHWPAKGTDIGGLPLRPGGTSFRPDSRQVMFRARVDGQETLQVCDVLTGAVQATLAHPARISYHAWHPDGRMIATCCDDHKIRLWDTATWQQTLVLEGHTNRGAQCVFTPDGDRLLSNDWSWLLRVWDVQTGRQLFTTAMSYDMHHFGPDGRLAVNVGNHVNLIRIATGHGFRTLPRRASASPKAYATVHAKVALSPDGRLLAVTTEEGTCALVDPASGAELAVILQNRTIPIQFEASGALLAHGPAGLCRWPVQGNPATGCWRVGPPQLLFPSRSDDHYGSSADGRVLAIPNYSQGALLLHRDRAGPPLVLGPQEDVRFCAVSPDGRWVATGNHFYTQGIGVKVWNASSGKLVKEFPMNSGSMVGFSPEPEGKWLVTTGGGCRLWAVGTWEEGPFISKEGFFAFSPDGQVMAVAGDDHGIRLVETATGREYVRLDTTEQTRFSPQTFTPDGAWLIALGSESRALHVWDLRRIREGLVELGLDWDAPPFPKAPDLGKKPSLEVKVDQKNIDVHLNRNLNIMNVVNKLRVMGDHAGALAVIQKAQAAAAPEDLDLNNSLAWLLVISPDPKMRDTKRAVSLASKSLHRWDSLRTLGLAYHFDGNNQNAVAALRRSVELRLRGDACDFFLLAVAHQQLGNKEEARKWYDQGVVGAREKRYPYLREMAILRAYAETALGIGKQPAPAPTMPPGGKEKR